MPVLGDYLPNPEKLVGKIFSNCILPSINGISTYKVLKAWKDEQTGDVMAKVEEYDFGELRRIPPSIENLTLAVGMHAFPELIYGANAEQTSLSFHRTSI